jgi:diacylglycerol kinase (ATP)
VALKQVAVLLHEGKTFGGGRRELRRLLKSAGYDAPLWYEVPKSKKAPKALGRALSEGAELVFVWGGDGMVQRTIDAMADRKHAVPIAILPAGTGNLLANNLGIPLDLAGAVALGFHGAHQPLDVGVINGERFAVMAGTGVDAITMRDVTTAEKKKVGRLAYFRSASNALRGPAFEATIHVNGKRWFTGRATCVLAGNVGAITGGIEVFPNASPIDGKLELAVVTASTALQWARVFARVATGHASRSPFVRTTRATKVTVTTSEARPYELDGGDREPTKKLKLSVERGAVTLCLPAPLKAPRARRGRAAAKKRT